MSLDAYARTVGGAITLAVTGTDNPVPTQGGNRKNTPSEPVSALPPVESVKVEQPEAVKPEARPQPTSGGAKKESP